MPKDKDLKRLVRARMQKTGESYTAARAQVIKKNAPLPADYARLAGMSDDAVRAKTGKTWKQWVRTLDAIDATALAHREIAARVHADHDVSGWWAQTVAVGYERIRGLRDIGQRRGGGYEANKSKTIGVPVSRLYQAFSDEPTRHLWLTGVELTIRTARPDRSLRVTWQDGTPVDVSFTAKGEDRSQVSIQHRKLASAADKDRMREYWGERLDELAALLMD